MAKLILFSGKGYTGSSREFRSNDPDLVINNDDYEFLSAIAVAGSWTLYDAVSYAGAHINLDEQGGPDADGAFKDPVDFGKTAAFHVRSINFSE